jgi:effector-binding domain-containing protein
MMQRNKEFKYRKGIDPFEVYLNMPGEVPNEQLVTEINFPVAG